MPRAPNKKRPAHTVPEPADHHGNHEVQVGEDFPAGAQAGQREVEVIAQPVRKREIVVQLQRVTINAGKHFGARVKFRQIENAIHQGLS